MLDSPVTRSFLRTTVLVAGINIGSKLLGVLREAMVANAFGAREATDAFFTAWRLPDVLFNSLVGVLIANTFIPVYYELLERKGADAARAFVAGATGALLAVLCLVAALYALFSGPIVDFLAPGLSAQASSQAADMARALAVVVAAGGLTGVARSLLHAGRRFLLPAWLPVVQNVCMIAMVILLASRFGVRVMAWSLVLSSLLQAGLLLAPLIREGAFPFPSLSLATPGLARMGRLMAPVAAAFVLGNVIPLLEVHLASGVSAGAISHLSYAYRLFTLPEQIFALALSAVLFPFLARDASQGNNRAMTEKFSAGMRFSLYLMLPAGIFLSVFSTEVVTLFLGRGAFGPDAVEGTAAVLTAYCAGLFAVCARSLLVDACFAITAPGIILRVAAVMIPLNAGLDVWLCGTMGTQGLALGFALTAIAHCVVLAMALRSRLGGIDGRAMTAALARSALSATAMGGLCLLARPWTRTLFDQGGFAVRLWALCLAGAGAALVYAVVQASLKSPEQALILKAIRGRRP